ncbi:MAG: class I SAM-dependent methyltransferase [Planctomycetota bacterium]
MNDQIRSGARRLGLWIAVWMMVSATVCVAQPTAKAQDPQVAEIEAQIQQLESRLAALRRSVAPADEESVKPGINDSWKSSNIEPLVARLEAESREIFTKREEIAALVGPEPGSVVADVGAGSGFMAMLFAERVGPKGKVIAVDINDTLLDSVAKHAKEQGLSNLETVVCTEKSVELPPASVDLIFICDTYHHFEYPQSTLATIYRALKPGGQLVVIDFHRIPGVSPEWILGHVRAGQEVFSSEITAAGFDLVNVHTGPLLEQNYVLRFLKR